MEAKEIPLEAPLLPLDKAAEKLGITDRQLRTLRKEVEAVLGKRLAKSGIEEGRRVLYLPLEAVEIIQAWRDRKDPEALLQRYGSRSEVSALQQEDWSFADDETAIDAEFVDTEEDLAIVAITPVQIQITRRSAQVENLIAQIAVNALQIEVNQRNQEEAQLMQVKEDAKLAFLKKQLAQQEAEKEMAESLARAKEAAKASLSGKGGKRSAKSF